MADIVSPKRFRAEHEREMWVKIEVT